MVNVEIIIRFLNALHENLALLRPMQKMTLKELTANGIQWNGILHLLQLCVEQVSDIGAHLLAANDMTVPDEHREIIIKMGRSNFIPSEFAERIGPMAGFRNVVAHEYLTIDPEKVGDVLYNHLTDFEEFSVYIYDYLRREGYIKDEK